MRFPKSIEKAVQEYVQGIDGWREISVLAGAANADLYYGDTSGYEGLREAGLMQGGFSHTCKAVASWLVSEVGTLYVDEDSGFVMTREPRGEAVEDDMAEFVSEMAALDDTFEGKEPNWREPELYYTLERKDIAAILFGRELARYL